MSLASLSSSYIYVLLLIFCRITAIFLFAPIFSDSQIPKKVSIIFAFFCSLLIYPVVMNLENIDIPKTALLLGYNVVLEVLIGAFIGLYLRLIIAVAHIFGYIISTTIGLSAATLLDPSQSTQGTLIGNFLTMLIIVLMFSLGVDHAFIKTLVFSYKKFSLGSFTEFYSDITTSIIQSVSTSWMLAMKASVAFMIAGIVINVSAGILAKLMPQIQAFFLVMPLQLLIGFFLLSITLSSVMLWLMEEYQNYLIQFTR